MLKIDIRPSASIINATACRIHIGASLIEPHDIHLGHVSHLEADPLLKAMCLDVVLTRKVTRVIYPTWFDSTEPHYIVVPELCVVQWLAATKPTTATIITVQGNRAITIHGEAK